MNVPRSSIFLGDVAIALRELQPDGEEAPQLGRLITEILGFEPAPENIAPGVLTVAQTPDRPVDVQQDESEPVLEDAKYANEAAAAVPEPVAARWLPSTIKARPLEQSANDAAALLAHVPPLPAPSVDVLDSTEAKLTDPLFKAAWSRAIFTALLATCRDGALDLDALIEKVARREYIDRLPHEAVPTLRRGAQVLVDTSTGVAPFFDDQAWALDQIESVASRDQVTVLNFTRLPSRGIMAGFDEPPKPYRPPLPGTPVILLSDLGIAHPVGVSERASGEEWADFARQVRRAGCPLVALLPYAPARWPGELRGLITMVQWDPCTTAGRVRRIIGRAHRID